MYSLLLQLFCLSFIVNTAAAAIRNRTLHSYMREHARQENRSRFGSVPYGPIIWSCSIPGTVALTFDDGPSSFTPGVLNTLNRHGARATFFGQGRIDDASTPWPGLVRRVHASGHQIGSHGWQHIDMSTVGPEARLQDVTRLERALDKILGFYPTYFRPPYGSCDAPCRADLAGLAYHVVNFNVDTKDYEHDSPDGIRVSMDIFAAAVSGSPAGSSYIVLSHDAYGQTRDTLLPFMLETLTERGFRAVTVGECLGDPVENWYRTRD